MRRPALLLVPILAGCNRLAEVCPAPVSVAAGQSPQPGDANADGAVDVSDAVYLHRYLLRGGPAPACDDVGNVIGDRLDVGDGHTILSALFQGVTKFFDEHPCAEPALPSGGGAYSS